MITPADSAPEPPAQMAASSWDIQAPYDGGTPGHVDVHGAADPGGSDKTSGTVEGSVAAAMARQSELASDTYGLGSVIGDLMPMPPGGLDPSASSPGTTDPSGAFYDPPRNYGG